MNIFIFKSDENERVLGPPNFLICIDFDLPVYFSYCKSVRKVAFSDL